MRHDPTDKTHRKPRQLRNMPLLKYVRLASLTVTLLFAGVAYIFYRKHIHPRIIWDNSESTQDEQEMIQDYATNIFMKGTIAKIIERQRAKQQTVSQNTSKNEAESENTSENETKPKNTPKNEA